MANAVSAVVRGGEGGNIKVQCFMFSVGLGAFISELHLFQRRLGTVEMPACACGIRSRRPARVTSRLCLVFIY